MDLELHRTAEVFERFGAEWNALLERGVCRVPFLRAEYQQAWWRHLGGGEWPEAELLVVSARDEVGRLIGVAPLFSARNSEGRRALLLVGSHAISDFLDLVVEPKDLDAFAGALLDCLTTDVTGWEVLDLYNLPADSPSRPALARAAAGHGWAATEQLLEPSPIIRLPDTWDAYLAMMDKKERHELKRKMRRAEGGEDQIAWRMVGSEAVETFLEMMALDPDKARFLTPAKRAQFRAIVEAARAHGWLQLTFLEVNGCPAAAYLSFDFGNRLWVYNSAIDQRYSALSAGWVLLGNLLRWAIDNKRAAFDFMRGGEDYKFRFGGVAEMIYRLQISPSLAAGDLGGQAASTQTLAGEYFPK